MNPFLTREHVLQTFQTAKRENEQASKYARSQNIYNRYPIKTTIEMHHCPMSRETYREQPESH